ncbi:MAG: PTS fructose transporter subunit IIA [Nitrospinae bacterium]|nr:PTS fructose transporter subunit IIA [Nitrospinota bacterium]
MRIGHLIIAHGLLASEFLSALEFITGPQSSFKALALDHALDVDRARDIVLKALEEIKGDEGSIVLTDLFGGAPSNIAISLIDERKIEIVAGINLPLLIHAVVLGDSLPLKEKALKLRDYGRSNVFLASEVLSGGK